MQKILERSHISDRLVHVIFFVCAVLLIAVILSITFFIGSKAFIIFFQGVDLRTFLTSHHWDPTGGSGEPSFGAGGLILGSVITSVLAVIITVPLAIGTAVFFTELAPKSIVNILQPLIEIFTGVPSVVMGFLGLVILVPFLQKVSSPITGGLALGGYGWGAATLVLATMILPTITSISIDALRVTPNSIREASLALGATHWQTTASAVIPAASAGLGTAVVLGMTRAIGETLAVSLVLAGSSFPDKLFTLATFFQPNVNITMLIARDFGETSGISEDAYWTLAFVLLVISFLFVCISRFLASRSVYK